MCNTLSVMTTPYYCPECGGRLYLDTEAETERVMAPAFHVRGRQLPTQRVRIIAAFCTECEFALEIQPDLLREQR